MTNRTKSEFTSHCRIAAKTNFLMLLLCPARFAHARYSSRMIDRFLNWGDHGKPKSGKIKGRCQPPLVAPLAFQISSNRPFPRYSGHIELIRFKQYYWMNRGHEQDPIYSLNIYARSPGQFFFLFVFLEKDCNGKKRLLCGVWM